jgi:prepilin-type N-terminal cleavage/methylation domain-containing protein
MKQINKDSFTLIEIIVVLIILGVLCAVALPNIFSWIRKSHAAEALIIVKNMGNQFSACAYTGKTATQCETDIINQCVANLGPNFTCSGGLEATGEFAILGVFENTPPGAVQFTGVVCPGYTWALNLQNQGYIGVCLDANNPDTKKIVGFNTFGGMFSE